MTASRDVLPALLDWWHDGRACALATVVGTWSSAPRQAGASMLVGTDGSVVGSLSGGCVEGDVYAVAEQVLADGAATTRRYGVSDSDAADVGLTCGGIIDVFVERVEPSGFADLAEVAADVDAGRPVAVATVVRHPDPSVVGRRLVVRPDRRPTGTLGSSRRDDAVVDDARGLLGVGQPGVLTYGPGGERRGEGLEVFVATYAPRPRMLVFGATDHAAAVAATGSFLGYRVTVCDARPVFATTSRFPTADEVVVDWPHRYLRGQAESGLLDDRTVVCVLSHDPKFDVPVLEVALRLPTLGYVGAMGSRRTAERTRAALRTLGLTERELGGLSSPIGLDLGARTPEETAVSVAAEIIAARQGHGALPLRLVDGPIHSAADATPQPAEAGLTRRVPRGGPAG
ncbi:MAG: XdhC family protein [Janthinobacterium lividum]